MCLPCYHLAQVCDKYGVTLFYTAPTAIRTLMACGDQHVTKHKCAACLPAARLFGLGGRVQACKPVAAPLHPSSTLHAALRISLL